MRQTLEPKRDAVYGRKYIFANKFTKIEKPQKNVGIDSFASIKEELQKL